MKYRIKHRVDRADNDIAKTDVFQKAQNKFEPARV